LSVWIEIRAALPCSFHFAGRMIPVMDAFPDLFVFLTMKACLYLLR
jgi:hypothetical protein